jgi:hypothetical protein
VKNNGICTIGLVFNLSSRKRFDDTQSPRSMEYSCYHEPTNAGVLRERKYLKHKGSGRVGTIETSSPHACL